MKHDQLELPCPAGLESGPAFVELLNPPFIPFTSSGTTPAARFSLP